MRVDLHASSDEEFDEFIAIIHYAFRDRIRDGSVLVFTEPPPPERREELNAKGMRAKTMIMAFNINKHKLVGGDLELYFNTHGHPRALLASWEMRYTELSEWHARMFPEDVTKMIRGKPFQHRDYYLIYDEVRAPNEGQSMEEFARTLV